MKPWEKEEFIDFLNELNDFTTNKYGWNVVGHNFENDEMLKVIFTPALGMDSQNRKF